MAVESHGARPVGASQVSRLLDRLVSYRNALLGSLRFQRLAASIPGSRFIAQRRAREVFDLCAGFVYSQILLSCVRLGFFEHLKNGPLPFAVLSGKIGLSDAAARRLLNAAEALKLVEKRAGDRYVLGMHGAVIAGNPGILRMIEHHQMLYADLVDPVALLKREKGSGQLNKYWAYAGSEAPDDLTTASVDRYTALMSASQTLIADDILAAYPFASHKRLLDVGGGDGTFLRAVARRVPNLELVLFDLPAVAERARAAFVAEGHADRVTAIGGDFFRDPLPQGADLISLVRIVHDHDDEPVLALFRAARTALAPGGKLIIAEPMSGEGSAGPVGDAYFGFYLMAMGSGRPRTAAELSSMLNDAGFSDVRQIKTRMPLHTSLLVAGDMRTSVKRA